MYRSAQGTESQDRGRNPLWERRKPASAASRNVAPEASGARLPVDGWLPTIRMTARAERALGTFLKNPRAAALASG
jgi:hypothetical protein